MNDAGLGAEEVAAKEFPVSFRGFAQHDVRAFLAQVAAELAAARERERLQRERLEAAEERAASRTLSDAEVETALGHEAGKVLQAAREAATEIRSRAEEQVERLVRDASGEGTRLQEEAESLLARRTEEAERAAEEIRSEAERSAEAEVEEAKARGREMVAEAQAVRERVLKDLARRRRVAHQQLEQLRAGRERLLEAYRVVRSTLDEATKELSAAEAEARVAAEMASLRMGAQAETTVDQLEAELAAARDIGLDLVPSPPAGGHAPGSDGAPGVTAPAGAEGSAPVGGPGEEREAEDEEVEADPDPPALAISSGPAAPAPVGVLTGAAADIEDEAPAPGQSTEPAPELATEPLAEVPLPELATGTDERAAPESASPESASPEQSGPASASPRPPEPQQSQPAQRPLEPAQPSVPEPSEPEPLAAPRAPEPQPVAAEGSYAGPPPGEAVAASVAGDVEELFARLRAERAAAVAAAEDVLAEPVPAPEPGPAASNGDAPAPVPEDDEADVATVSSSGDDDVLQIRDAELEPVERSLVKALKRALADEQNEVLDSLRRRRGPTTLVDLLPGPSDHTARYLAVAGPGLELAAAAGAGPGGDAPSTDDLGVKLAAEVVDDLRARLQRALEASDGDEGRLVEGISAAYREWKTSRVEPSARHHAVAAHNRGRFATAAEGPLHWVVDGEEGPCPDCEDNSLAGATPKGTPFPTGQQHPPAHVGCRCTIMVEPG